MPPQIRKNILYLGLIQAGNALTPLVVLPYLARALGVNAFGEFAWIQSIMLLGIAWVEFGFSLSATRAISGKDRQDPSLSKIIVNTWTVQWLLFLVYILIVFSLTLWFGVATAASYFIGVGIVIGNTISPLWLFQGLDILRIPSIISFLGKLAMLPLLFVFVKSPNDLPFAILYLSACSLLTGIISLCWLCKKQFFKFERPDPQVMNSIFWESAILFPARFQGIVYSYCMPIFLGIYGGQAQLAYFSIADKLRTSIQSLISPIIMGVFPRMTALFVKETEDALSLLKRTLLLSIIFTGMLGILIYIFSDSLVVLFGGHAYLRASSTMRWLAFVPLLTTLTGVFGMHVMIPLGMNKIFTSVQMMAVVLWMILIIPFVSHSGSVGAAKLTFCSELLLALSFTSLGLKKIRSMRSASFA